MGTSIWCGPLFSGERAASVFNALNLRKIKEIGRNFTIMEP